MMWRKWRIARALDQGRLKDAQRLAEAGGLQQYRASLAQVDDLLRSQSQQAQRAAPSNLPSRIMEAIAHESHASRARPSRALPLARRIFAPVAAAAALVVAVLAWQSLLMPSAPEAVEQPQVAVVPSPLPPDVNVGAAVHVSLPGQPVGRLVMERLGGPLMNEVELLRRDTQSAADFVISSLPFARQ